MAQVAAEASMSSGLIYTYVESKEALFHQVIAAGFGQPTDVRPTLPVPTPAPGATLALIRGGLRKLVATPRLRAAVAERNPPDVVAELASIVEERYLTIERAWPVLAVIERSAIEVPGLEELYFERSRHAYFDQLTRYLELRAGCGYIRVTPDAALASRIVSETIVWFAWHRHEGRDSELYDDDQARQGVIQFILDALVRPSADAER
jgi:AcrR family transcriptional regulator